MATVWSSEFCWLKVAQMKGLEPGTLGPTVARPLTSDDNRFVLGNSDPDIFTVTSFGFPTPVAKGLLLHAVRTDECSVDHSRCVSPVPVCPDRILLNERNIVVSLEPVWTFGCVDQMTQKCISAATPSRRANSPTEPDLYRVLPSQTSRAIRNQRRQSSEIRQIRNQTLQTRNPTIESIKFI
jgi:hypothetical protein